MRTLISVLLLASLAIAQAPDAPMPQPPTHLMTYSCTTDASNCNWRPLPAFQSHEHWPHRVATWPRRHPLATYFLILGAGGVVFTIEEWPHSCHSKYNGIPYNGTECPKYCEALGDCYWGPRGWR